MGAGHSLPPTHNTAFLHGPGKVLGLEENVPCASRERCKAAPGAAVGAWGRSLSIPTTRTTQAAHGTALRAPRASCAAGQLSPFRFPPPKKASVWAQPGVGFAPLAAGGAGGRCAGAQGGGWAAGGAARPRNAWRKPCTRPRPTRLLRACPPRVTPW